MVPVWNQYTTRQPKRVLTHVDGRIIICKKGPAYITYLQFNQLCIYLIQQEQNAKFNC